jgi:hypothetical protein
MTTYDEVQKLARMVNQKAGGWGNEGALVNKAGWKGELLSALNYVAPPSTITYITTGVDDGRATVKAFTPAWAIWGTWSLDDGVYVVALPLERLESVVILSAPNAMDGSGDSRPLRVEVTVAGKVLSLPARDSAGESNASLLEALVRSLTAQSLTTS